MEQNGEKIIKSIIIAGMIPKIITTGIFLLIGLFITLINIIGIIHQIDHTETIGTIVDIKEEDGFFYPMYEFYVEEEKIIAKGFPSTEKPNNDIIGTQEIISYKQDDPTNIDIGSSKDRYIILGIWVLILIISVKEIYDVLTIFKKQ